MLPEKENNSLRIVFLFLILASCSSEQPNNLKHSTVRKIAVDSIHQAKLLIEKHHDYITLQFEQSRERGGMKIKWPDTCLKDNKIGQMKDYGPYIISESVLYLESGDTPGECKGSKNNFLMIYCNGDDFVREIITPAVFKAPDASKLCT